MTALASAIDALSKASSRPYPENRDSGVEWLGNVPEHWTLAQLGRFGSFFKGGGGTKEDEVEDGLPCVRYGDLYTEHQFLIKKTRANISESNTARYTAIHYGDLLFAGSGETLEEIGTSAVNLISGPAYCGGDVVLFRPSIEADATFLGYAADCAPAAYQKSCMGRGVTVMHIYSSELKRMLVPLPPLDEQRAIAAFLDRETERIDALVEKKRRLIERLQEYRTALITRTVTRGLPPEAARAAGLDSSPRMKPSGVEWLGDVPEHWEVARFSREVDIAEGQVDPEVEPYAAMLLIAPNHVASGTGRLLNSATASEQAAISGKYFCRVGDVIYSKIRPGLAKVVVAPADCLCSADMYPLRPRDSLSSSYLFWLLLSDGFVAWSILESDRVAMPKINRETLCELRLPIPPVSEQNAIATYLARETERIDALSEKAETAIGETTGTPHRPHHRRCDRKDRRTRRGARAGRCWHIAAHEHHDHRAGLRDDRCVRCSKREAGARVIGRSGTWRGHCSQRAPWTSCARRSPSIGRQ